jgi:hypothetical protein
MLWLWAEYSRRGAGVVEASPCVVEITSSFKFTISAPLFGAGVAPAPLIMNRARLAVHQCID